MKGNSIDDLIEKAERISEKSKMLEMTLWFQKQSKHFVTLQLLYNLVKFVVLKQLLRKILHIKSFYSKEFKCEYCIFKCKNEGSLKSHMRKTHTKLMKAGRYCDFCHFNSKTEIK